MEVVSKPCQDRFLHPILVHSILEKKENIGSQMGHTKLKAGVKGKKEYFKEMVTILIHSAKKSYTYALLMYKIIWNFVIENLFIKFYQLISRRSR